MTDRQTDRQLENCTFVKTVLTIIVILCHSMAFWRGDWFSILPPVHNTRWLGVVVDYFSSFHVYTFTLVSGFIYYHVRYRRVGYKNFCRFIKKKAQRLLIPYVFTAICWVIPWNIGKRQLNLPE